MRLDRILRDHGEARLERSEAALHVGVLAQHRPADHEHDVVRRKPLAQARAVGGKVTGEETVILREPGARAERLLPDRRNKPLCKLHERSPGVRVVRTCTGDDRRRRRACEQLGDLRDLGPDCRGAEDAVGRSRLRITRRRGPVVHRHDHDRRTAVRRRLVCGAGDRTRHVLRTDRLVDPDGILTGELVEAPGEKGLEREVAAILLADEHDERRAVHAGGRERRNGIAEPGSRMEERQRGLVAAEREARRHADHRGFVQTEHEAEVIRQSGEKRHLGRARIRKQRGEPVPAKNVERGVANRGAHQRGIVLRIIWQRSGGSVRAGNVGDAHDAVVVMICAAVPLTVNTSRFS